jgi:diaminopimelate decarboxylase
MRMVSLSAPPETPAYVLDLNALSERCQALRGGADRLLSYSLKTLPVPEAIVQVNRAGWLIEVVSAEEYEFAAQCGIPSSDIILNGPAKADSLIVQALTGGGLMHADSLDELTRAAKIQRDIARQGGLGLRLGLGVAEPAWSRFGIDISDESTAIEQIVNSTYGVPVTSFHVHSGKNRVDVQEFLEVTRRAIRFAERYSRRTGERLDSIDLGSGFPDPSAPPAGSPDWKVPGLQDFFEAAENLLVETWGFGPRPALIFEPGRALAGPHVSLYCSVVAVKEVGGTQVITLDTGINSLPFARHFDYPLEVLKGDSGSLFPTILCGPLCMSDDILRSGVRLPRLFVGDVLCFGGVGAYNLSMSFNFIKRHARLFVLDQGEFIPSKLMFAF